MTAILNFLENCLTRSLRVPCWAGANTDLLSNSNIKFFNSSKIEFFNFSCTERVKQKTTTTKNKKTKLKTVRNLLRL